MKRLRINTKLQRNDDKIEWAAAEEKRAAGINYALSQTGLYSAREEFRAERYKNIKMPLYIYVSRPFCYFVLKSSLARLCDGGSFRF